MLIRKTLLTASLLYGLIGGLKPMNAYAENIIFPHAKNGITDISGIIDVVRDPAYKADNTGKTDVTAILQKALDDHAGWTTIYLPNGTYQVTNTLTWKVCNPSVGGTCVQGPIMQGQSRKGTVIRLKDATFTSAAAAKDVIKTGGGVAQDMFRGLHNFTVNVGRNNPGANGVFWYANNEGLMSDVDIISEDGKGNIGLNLGSGEQGPCGMRDVYVKGFTIGCKSDALNSITLLRLSLEGQSQSGVVNAGNTLYIDSLTSINTVPAVVVQGGNLTLVNARLTGGTAAAAIQSSGYLFARGIYAQGYGRAISSSGGRVTAPTGTTVAEYSSHGQVSQFSSPTHSIGVPYKAAPEPAWEQDTTKWGNIRAYKGGLGMPGKSDHDALQTAIDDPKNTTICLPSSAGYSLDADILVRGNINRIVGTGGRFLGGTGRLIITSDGTQPAIKIERILGVQILNQSNKSVIIESYIGSTTAGALTSTGSGDLFLSDVGGDFIIDNPNQRVWAWQFDAEGGQDCIPNHINLTITNARMVRVFGWKDEGCGLSAAVRSGIVEFLGFLYYSYSGHVCCNSGVAGSWDQQFLVQDPAQFCLAGAQQLYFSGSGFSNLVTETRGTVTKTLLSSQNPTGQSLPLYTGYDSTKIPADLSAAQAPMPIPREQGIRFRAAAPGTVVLENAWTGGRGRMEVFTASGVCIRRVDGPAGDARCVGLPPGMYAIKVTSGPAQRTMRLVVPR